MHCTQPKTSRVSWNGRMSIIVFVRSMCRLQSVSIAYVDFVTLTLSTSLRLKACWHTSDNSPRLKALNNRKSHGRRQTALWNLIWRRQKSLFDTHCVSRNWNVQLHENVKFSRATICDRFHLPLVSGDLSFSYQILLIHLFWICRYFILDISMFAVSLHSFLFYICTVQATAAVTRLSGRDKWAQFLNSFEVPCTPSFDGVVLLDRW